MYYIYVVVCEHHIHLILMLFDGTAQKPPMKKNRNTWAQVFVFFVKSDQPNRDPIKHPHTPFVNVLEKMHFPH